MQVPANSFTHNTHLVSTSSGVSLLLLRKQHRIGTCMPILTMMLTSCRSESSYICLVVLDNSDCHLQLYPMFSSYLWSLLGIEMCSCENLIVCLGTMSISWIEHHTLLFHFLPKLCSICNLVSIIISMYILTIHGPTS